MVEAVGELIGHMGKLNLAPPSPALEVLERALLLLGKARADLCDTRCERAVKHPRPYFSASPSQLPLERRLFGETKDELQNVEVVK